jgi:predicted PurR-regulated permease PerM
MSKTVCSFTIPIIRSIIVIISIICIFTVFVAVSAYAVQQQGQDIITIIPGASDKNNPSFFDVKYYPVLIGKEVRWYNADDVNHKIIISSGNETNTENILHQLHS